MAVMRRRSSAARRLDFFLPFRFLLLNPEWQQLQTAPMVVFSSMGFREGALRQEKSFRTGTSSQGKPFSSLQTARVLKSSRGQTKAVRCDTARSPSERHFQVHAGDATKRTHCTVERAALVCALSRATARWPASWIWTLCWQHKRPSLSSV